MKKRVIKNHFKSVDPIIYLYLKDYEFELLKPSKSHSMYFYRLCREIISQQLSVKAGNTILERFELLFPGKKILPDKILNLSDQKLRNVGMSWSKVKYIKDLALKTKERELNFQKLHEMENEDIMKELCKVKGIGRWTSEMFLMFSLGREDIYSYGDLGLTNAMKKIYSLKNRANLKNRIEKIVSKWSPYKSYGCLTLWNAVDK